MLPSSTKELPQIWAPGMRDTPGFSSTSGPIQTARGSITWTPFFIHFRTIASRIRATASAKSAWSWMSGASRASKATARAFSPAASNRPVKSERRLTCTFSAIPASPGLKVKAYGASPRNEHPAPESACPHTNERTVPALRKGRLHSRASTLGNRFNHSRYSGESCIIGVTEGKDSRYSRKAWSSRPTATDTSFGSHSSMVSRR
jgi:hypothetical protein